MCAAEGEEIARAWFVRVQMTSSLRYAPRLTRGRPALPARIVYTISILTRK